MLAYLDLKNGFFHVLVEKDSRKYTAFVTHSGQYQFLRVPFGLCNSPSVFQRFINCIFRDLTKQGIALLYLDDVIIPAANDKEGLERVKLVLQRASDYGLQINMKKCYFLKRSIEFLGHIIKEGKLYPSYDKIKAVIIFPEPKGAKDVQSFLGLSGYFRKFIPLYSIIAKPLSDLLKKDRSYQFAEKERKAFEMLKSSLAGKPVLKIHHRDHETEVHTDASQNGYGAVLLQRADEDNELHPVYYMSRKTTPAERNYTSYELEVLAVIEALKKFKVYLLGMEKQFKIRTDCEAFEKTMDKKDLTTRVARWALLLENYNYKVVYRPGVRMKHVDALSRYPVMVISASSIIPQIKKAQEEDQEIQAIIEILKIKSYDSYCMKGGLVYKFKEGRDLLVIPKAMQTGIIQSAHQKGHFAAKRTEEMIGRKYYIPDLTRKVEQHIANCVACIIMNHKGGKREGLLHSIGKPDVPLHTYHVDHLGPLEKTSKAHNHIFAIIDSFTKFAWLYPTKSTTTREVINKLDIQKQVFGNPVQIISDKGTAFTYQDF